MGWLSDRGEGGLGEGCVRVVVGGSGWFVGGYWGDRSSGGWW